MRQHAIGLLLGLASSCNLQAAPVVDWVATNGDTGFADGSEATNSPVTTDADAETIIGSFPAVTLGIDDSIVLSGAFNITGRVGSIPGNQIRWALFDAPGVPATGAGAGYVGVWATIAGGGATSNVRSANGSTDNPFSGSATTIISGATGTGGLAQFGTTYSFSLTITRVDESQMSVAAMITDGAGLLIEWEAATAPASPASFTYDSVGILIGGTTDATSASFTDIDVSTGEPQEIVATDIDYDTSTGIIAITFTSVPGKQYTLDSSDDLVAWTDEVDDSIPAAQESAITRYEFPDTGFGSRQFFRVRESP